PGRGRRLVLPEAVPKDGENRRLTRLLDRKTRHHTPTERTDRVITIDHDHLYAQRCSRRRGVLGAHTTEAGCPPRQCRTSVGGSIPWEDRVTAGRCSHHATGEADALRAAMMRELRDQDSFAGSHGRATT